MQKACTKQAEKEIVAIIDHFLNEETCISVTFEQQSETKYFQYSSTLLF